MQWIGPVLSLAICLGGVGAAVYFGPATCARYCTSAGIEAPRWNRRYTYALVSLGLCGLALCSRAHWVGLSIAGFLSVPLLCDFAAHRLPRLWVWAGGGALLCSAVAAYRGVLLPLAASALGIFCFFALFSVVTKMGFGDVRLAPVALSWPVTISSAGPLWAVAGSFLLAGCGALVAILRTHNPRAQIAFGPYLILGGYLSARIF